jgi:hypothetical protein
VFCWSGAVVTGSAPPQPTGTSPPALQIDDPTPPATADCPAGARIPSQNGTLPETQGVGRGATLFGPFFSGQATIGLRVAG